MNQSLFANNPCFVDLFDEVGVFSLSKIVNSVDNNLIKKYCQPS
jgi:hypothetical protein